MGKKSKKPKDKEAPMGTPYKEVNGTKVYGKKKYYADGSYTYVYPRNRRSGELY